MNCLHAKPGYPPCARCVAQRDRGVDMVLFDVEAAAFTLVRLARCAHAGATAHAFLWCPMCGAWRRTVEEPWGLPAVVAEAKELDGKTPVTGAAPEPAGEPDAPKIVN